MNAPFYAAANKILCMYELRQLIAQEKAPKHSPAERYWACERLIDLAAAAAYTGSKEALVIKAAAELWENSTRIPKPFPADLHEAHV
ncbi:MAG: hypothetical protein ACOH2G_08645 [Ewingella sp.]